MTELLLFVVVAAVCIGMVVLAIRIEPHWVAKDGSRFLTTAQPMDRLGRIIGRRREVRVSFLPDGRLMVSRRALVRSSSAVCRLEAKSPHPPKGRQVYLLRTMAADDDGELLALRVPAKSKVVPALDELVPQERDQPGAISAPTPDPGTRRWGRRADRR